MAVPKGKMTRGRGRGWGGGGGGGGGGMEVKNAPVQLVDIVLLNHR